MTKPMTPRAGTFLCWLFGHKFVLVTRETEANTSFIDGKRIEETKATQNRVYTDSCVRCGANR